MECKEEERQRRWRLILGEPPQKQKSDSSMVVDWEFALTQDEKGMDSVLGALYDSEKTGGLGSSSPNVSTWLGDIRKYFPSSMVQIMQKDALERLHLRELLLEPDILANTEPNVELVANLLSLKNVIPMRTKETARQVVRKVVQELERRLRNPLIQAIKGSLQRSTKTHHPRANEIDWNSTIRANMKNYLPERKTIIVERLIGFGRKRNSLRDIILCVDQSGSMATSVIYSSIFGAVLASLKAVSTRMIVFDTNVADLSENLQDPVDLLFGAQLGGGTNIHNALKYCQQVITHPNKTILILITDLYEGGKNQLMHNMAANIVASGVQMICLLALNDKGSPSYDHKNAEVFANIGIPSFACTPDLFPDLMACVINRQDISAWASKNNIATVMFQAK